MTIIWNPYLVILSILVAIFGSVTALVHANRMRESRGLAELVWIITGGITLGLAIWAMHFIGMLAFHLPVPVSYDLELTLLSVLPAVTATLLGFYLLRAKEMHSGRIAGGSLIMGLGISVMHYTGMAALKMSPPIIYDPVIVFASVGIAVLASYGALLIVYTGEKLHLPFLASHGLGGLVMGLAISGMHYTAMAGTHFPSDSVCLEGPSRIDPDLLTLFVSTNMFFLLCAGILASLFEQRMSRQKADVRLHQFLQRDMEERTRTMAVTMIEELRVQNQALSSISQGVLITDAQRRVTYVNDAFEQITGYARADLIGKSCAILQGAGTNPATAAELREALNAGLPFHGEILNYRKNGKPFWNELSITPVYDNLGELAQFVGVQRDITESKQARQREHIRNQVLELLAKDARLPDILDALARSVEAEHSAILCSIRLMDEEGNHLMFAAGPSLPEAYNRALYNISIGPCAGSCGTAAYRRKRVIVSDIGSDPLWADYQQLALSCGLQACWSQPILSSTGQVLGTFAIYYKEIRSPNDTELTAISDAANIACVAIEHTRSQQALRIAATVFETQEGIVITDSNKAVLRINQAFTRIYGYSIEDLIGTTPSILQSGRSEDEFYDEMWEKLQSDKHWTGEIWDKRKNGEDFPAWLTITAVTAEDGSVTHFVGTFSDITDYKRNQEELQIHRDHLQELVEERTADLRDSTKRIHAILDTVAEGIITIDERGIVETFNPAAERIFGYTAGEIVGRNVNLLMPEPFHSLHDAYLEHYRTTGEMHIIGIRREVVGQRRDGSTCPLELAVSKMQLGEGRFFTGIVRDITERKLSEQALVAAKTEAEHANRTKSDFLAAMSHEIRTPMNGVIGMVDVLHQTSLKGYQVEMVDIIRESAFSLLGIIEDILDFSKIEAGKLEIEHAPTAVAEVVEKVCIMLDRLAENKGVELTLFTDPAIPAVVLSDAQRLRQIVINLANNAIKFSSGQDRPGRVSVQAVLVERDAERAVVEIRVIDNGIGMDQEIQSRLFTPFTQADVSTTRRFGGTGLGLSIARNLVQLMTGEISVQSVPDQGAIFTVRLPLVPVSDQAEDSDLASLIVGLSCLVVGSAEGMADHLAAYLAAAGAVVEQAPNLAAAYEQAAPPPGSGPWVWVIDAGTKPPLQDELRAIISARPAQDVRLFVIGRGKRRRPPRQDADQMVKLDGNILTRQLVLQAVAIAAGRVQAEMSMPQSGKAESAFIAPSRIDALGQGRLILVAEDNKTNQKVIRQQLALLGFAADVTDNGCQALEHWRSGDYTLLFTDLHMPKMDGYELTAAIRAEETSARRIVIIALTANTLKSESLHCLDAGMDDYLSKPVPLADLNAMLEKWLPTAAPASQSADAAALLDASPVASAERNVVTKPVDVSVLAAQVGGEPEVLKEFLYDFRSSATRIAMELKIAYTAGQSLQVGALAHKLKSSARSVGALALGSLCVEIEQAGKAGQVEALTLLLPRFEAEIAAVTEYLDTVWFPEISGME